jgi:hypothetical protein
MKMNTEKTMSTSRNSKSSSLPLRRLAGPPGPVGQRPPGRRWVATSRSPVNVIRCITVCETDDLQYREISQGIERNN